MNEKQNPGNKQRIIPAFFKYYCFCFASNTYGMMQKTFRASTYIQHNRAIPNHIEGLVGYVKTMVKRFPDYSFDVKKIFADGEYVILHSHTAMNKKNRGNEKKGFIITDTFRLENGKLTEHWDAIQPIDFFSRFLILVTGGTIGNANPTF